MDATTYGLDVAKRVFQMYWVEAETGEIVNQRFGRDELIRFLARRPPGRIALEACGSAHWWARKIKVLGHEVVLLHAKFIRPFVQTNKTDAADARAIWTAVQQPGMRTVAAKTEEQQAMLSLHRMRLAGQVPHERARSQGEGLHHAPLRLAPRREAQEQGSRPAHVSSREFLG